MRNSEWARGLGLYLPQNKRSPLYANDSCLRLDAHALVAWLMRMRRR